MLQEPTETELIRFPEGRINEDAHFSHLEGRLLTIIEGIGLQPTQEKAIKDLVRGEVWQTYNNGNYITGEQYTRVMKENQDITSTHISKK